MYLIQVKYREKLSKHDFAENLLTISHHWVVVSQVTGWPAIAKWRDIGHPNNPHVKDISYPKTSLNNQ